MRRLMSWKFLFYRVVLPLLRRLEPARADTALGILGRIVARVRPGRRRAMASALRRGSEALDASWPIHSLIPELAANAARYQARDYPLDGLDDATALARFDVRGATDLIDGLQSGRGAILVGCHLGAHIAGLHWLCRRQVPLRVVAQRPRHVSSLLDRQFDSGGKHPQSELFVHRDLNPAAAVRGILLARDAIRDGIAVYLNGDIPWTGANTRPGRLVGRPHRLLTTWIDLALLTEAPVFWIFCTHEPGGRFALDIVPMPTLRAGDEDSALDHYLAELNARIANDPAEAIAHLLWSSYTQTAAPPPRHKSARSGKLSRRRPVRRTTTGGRADQVGSACDAM